MASPESASEVGWGVYGRAGVLHLLQKETARVAPTRVLPVQIPLKVYQASPTGRRSWEDSDWAGECHLWEGSSPSHLFSCKPTIDMSKMMDGLISKSDFVLWCMGISRWKRFVFQITSILNIGLNTFYIHYNIEFSENNSLNYAWELNIVINFCLWDLY